MNRHLRTYMLVFATAIATAIALTGIGRAADSSAQFELLETTIADIQAAYRAGILSPQDLVSMSPAGIAALNRSALPQPLNGGVGNQPLNRSWGLRMPARYAAWMSAIVVSSSSNCAELSAARPIPVKAIAVAIAVAKTSR